MHLKRRNSWPLGVSALDALNDYTWQTPSGKNDVLNKTNNKYYSTNFDKLTLYECFEK